MTEPTGAAPSADREGPAGGPAAADSGPPSRRQTWWRQWPVIGACLGAAAYGALKLHWALGGSTLMTEAPLPAAAIDDLLAREPATVAGHWITVALAQVAIVAALATTRAWAATLPRWLVPAGCWLLATAMVLRGAGQMIGSGQRLLAGVSEQAAHTARWDLFLWSPFFLLWGICWAGLGWSHRVNRRRRPAPDGGTARRR